MNNYTQRRLESELFKLVIDLVWSATDGGCKLKESDFSHFEEPLYEWTELVNKFSTSIAQADQEMLKRVKDWAKSKKEKLTMKWDEDKAKSTVYDSIIFNWDDFPLLSSLDKEIINPK